jgi:O-antigen/teichoic acid export membrane protein
LYAAFRVPINHPLISFSSFARLMLSRGSVRSARTFFRSTFLSNTLVNASGIVGGQLLVLIATPVLARQYTPADFGVYAAVVAVSGVIATSVVLRFDVALPSTLDGETPAMYRLGVFVCVASLLVGMLLVALGVHRLLPLTPSLDVTSVALLTTVAGALQGLLLLFTAALVRRGCFPHTAVLRIVQPLAFIAVALFSIPGGLPVAFAAGVLTTAAIGFALSWRHLVQPASHGIRQIARKYWEYPLISLPPAVLDTLALSMPLLFIVQHFGEGAAGNYSQVQRFVAAPLLLCAAAISQVFYKHAGDAARAGKSTRPLMWRTVRTLLLAGSAIVVLVALIGEPVLSLLLGKGWRTDSHYLLLILLPAVFRVSVSPITTIFMLARQVRLGALWQVIYAAATWSVLNYVSARSDIDGLLVAVLINEFVMYGLHLWMADLAVRRLDRRSVQCAA